MADREEVLRRLARYARPSPAIQPPSGRHHRPEESPAPDHGGSGWLPDSGFWTTPLSSPEPAASAAADEAADDEAADEEAARDDAADDDAAGDDDATDGGVAADEAADDAADDAAAGDSAGGARRLRRVRGQAWGRLAELWVPESLTDARVDPGRRGAVVLLVVATAAAIVTAVGVWRAQPEPRPVESVSVVPQAAAAVQGDAEAQLIGDSGSAAAAAQPSAATDDQPAAPGPPASGSPPPSPPAPATIVVSVTGLVARAGVVALQSGARVTDAIAAAGGATAEADLTGLNLATRLQDGDSVVVGTAGSGTLVSAVHSGGGAESAGPTGAAAGSTGALVDLNSADAAALDVLPGVGPVMAQQILAWRTEHGRFASVEQLQEISGIGPARYAQLAPLVTVS